MLSFPYIQIPNLNLNIFLIKLWYSVFILHPTIEFKLSVSCMKCYMLPVILIWSSISPICVLVNITLTSIYYIVAKNIFHSTYSCVDLESFLWISPLSTHCNKWLQWCISVEWKDFLHACVFVFFTGESLLIFQSFLLCEATLWASEDVCFLWVTTVSELWIWIRMS